MGKTWDSLGISWRKIQVSNDESWVINGDKLSNPGLRLVSEWGMGPTSNQDSAWAEFHRKEPSLWTNFPTAKTAQNTREVYNKINNRITRIIHGCGRSINQQLAVPCDSKKHRRREVRQGSQCYLCIGTSCGNGFTKKHVLIDTYFYFDPPLGSVPC